jgi:hypothetical protein
MKQNEWRRDKRKQNEKKMMKEEGFKGRRKMVMNEEDDLRRYRIKGLIVNDINLFM